MIISFNAYTSGTNTNYLASFSPQNMAQVLRFKLQQITSLKFYENETHTQSSAEKEAKIVPTILNEVD